MSERGVVLVTGATGRQGGAVASRLLEAGWSVRALTRDPAKPAASALADRGADVVAGDLDDGASLARALEGAYGVYSVQNFWEHGNEAEIRQGVALADAAQAAGVRHFVFSSVGGADRQSGVSHFETKWAIESHLLARGVPATVLRPVFFMENLNAPHYRGAILGGTLALALKPNCRLQLIAAEDVGSFAVQAFESPSESIGKAIEIAGDELTGPELAEALSRVLGRPVRFVPAPIERVRAMNPEVAEMFDWFDRDGYKADLQAVRALVPGLLTFEAWLRKTGWDKLEPPAGGQTGRPSGAQGR